VPDLTAGEIEVLEDGVPVLVLGAEPLAAAVATPKPGPPASVVEFPVPEAVARNLAIYVMPDLCTPSGLGRILDRVGEEAERLVSFGPVTVVLANPEPRVIGRRITDRAELQQLVEGRELRKLAPSRLVQIRRDFLTSLGSRPRMPVTETFTRAEANADSFRAQLTRAYSAVVEERSIVRGKISALVSWARSESFTGARVLLLGMDGFDLNPEEFYLGSLDPSGQAPGEIGEYQHMLQEFRAERLGPFVEETAGALAEGGWTVVSFDNGLSAMAGFANSAEQSGHGKLNAFVAGGSSEASPAFLFLHPRDPLQAVAETTGGVIVPPGGSLRAALEALGRTLLVTYQVERPADGRAHRVEVRCKRAGVVLTAPKRVFSGTQQGESEARARRVMASEKTRGGLPVTLSLIATDEEAKSGRRSGELRVRADLAGLTDVLAVLGKARLRVTVAVEITGKEPFFTHREEEMEPPAKENASWAYRVPLTWPPEARQVAVIVEELATGIWGAASMDLPGQQ
jgi:hypothetical protein